MKQLLIILLLVTLTVLSAQEFPVGVYIHTDTTTRKTIDYQKIKNLGVNWVIAHADISTVDSLKDFNVIAWNADSELDYINHYSGGYYSKWEAEDGASTPLNQLQPGIRHEDGTNGGNYWVADDTTEYGSNVVCGPYYAQEDYYHLANYQYGIDYEVNFNLKLVGDTTRNTPVCKLYVAYTVLDTLSNQITKPIDSLIINADTLSHDFQEFTITYSIPDSISGIETSPEHDKLILNKEDKPHGIQYIVKWLDTTGDMELQIDYIEVSESSIWGDYLENTSTLNNSILQYASQSIYNNSTNGVVVKYWYGVDEPVYIDQYIPYGTINEVLVSNSKPGLFTAFYPQWNGKQNYEVASNNFIDEVEPQKMMIDYYPFWPNKSNKQGLKTMRETYDRFYDEGENIPYYQKSFFVAQSHAYWNSDGTGFKRWPIHTELRANVMLALAHGVKGVFFWNYFSYNYTNGQRQCKGIIDTNGTKSELYYEIRDKLAPRLKGKLGNTLLNLDYQGDYAIYSRFANDSTVVGLTNLDLRSFDPDSANFHAGLLIDSTDSEAKYYMIANLICGDSTMKRSLQVNLTRPSGSSYLNYSLTSIEGEDSLKFSFSTSTGTHAFNFEAGEGKLFKYGPVLKYGGNIIADDTVSTNITLEDSMAVTNRSTVKINSTYNVNANISVENNSVIHLGSGGILKVIPTKTIGIESWGAGKLLIARTTGQAHPRIFWGEYNNAIYYQVHRKYGASAWQIIDTVYDGARYEYTDSTVTISSQVGGVEMKYFVTAVYFTENNPNYDSSSVADYNVYGGEIEKRVVEGEEVNLLPKEYSLSGNYPNPFNPSTTIKYALPEISDVRIEIFDITGRLVKDFGFGSQSAGYKETVWHGDNNNGIKVSSGIYIMRFKAAAVKGNRSFLKSHKLVLVK